MKSDSVVLTGVLAELSRRQLPAGGWAALRSSVQASLESTCLAALAVGTDDSDEARLAQEFLVRVQNPNGSWPAFSGDDRDGACVTSLASLALRDVATAIPARLSGIHWLMKCRGKEANWFWRWKFLMGCEPDRIVHIREGAKFLGNVTTALIDQAGEVLIPPATPFDVVPEFRHLYAV